MSSLKIITASTKANAAIISALEFSSCNGLESPFLSCLTDSSAFIATINLSPELAACAKYSICPRCNISKTPLVKTIFSLLDFQPSIFSKRIDLTITFSLIRKIRSTCLKSFLYIKSSIDLKLYINW